MSGQTGDRGDRSFREDDVLKKRARLRRHLEAERAEALATAGSFFDVAMFRSSISDDVEKILRMEILGPEGSALLEARFLEYKRLRAEANHKIDKEKTDAAKASLVQELGEMEYHQLALEPKM